MKTLFQIIDENGRLGDVVEDSQDKISVKPHVFIEGAQPELFGGDANPFTIWETFRTHQDPEAEVRFRGFWFDRPHEKVVAEIYIPFFCKEEEGAQREL